MAQVRRSPQVPGFAPRNVAEILIAAYPHPRERRRAITWLAWIAWQSAGQRAFGWWQIPGWLGEQRLRRPRMLLGGAVIGLVTGAGLAVSGSSAAMPGGLGAAAGAGFLSAAIRKGRLRLAPRPAAMTPQLPRTAREGAVLVLALASGVLLRRTLIRHWSRPVAGSSSAPDSSYLACLKSTGIDAVACLLAGTPLAVTGAVVRATWLFGIGCAVSGFAVMAALADGKVPALWQAGLVKQDGCRAVSFRRLLGRAVGRRILVPAGTGYAFGDAQVWMYLAALQQGVVDGDVLRAAARKDKAAARRQKAAERKLRYARVAAAATGGFRPWLLGMLSEAAQKRLAWVIGAGTAVGFTVADVLRSTASLRSSFAVVDIMVAGLFVYFGWMVARWALGALAGVLRWSLGWTGQLSPRVRVAALAGAVCVAALITLWPGPAAVRHGLALAGVAVLPAVTVAVTGGWAVALLHQRCQVARDRLVRYVADVLGAAVAGLAVLLLMNHSAPAAQAVAGLLFPLAVVLSIRVWRAMNESDLLPVRACADIAVSLLLGASLLALLVWVANLLKMPPEEVGVLRETADMIGKLLDLRWWIWVSLYVVLAAAVLAFGMWPARLRRPGSWFARLRVLPGIEILQRGSAGVHIGLLLILLLGAAGPAAIGPVLRERVAEKYVQTLIDTARTRGEAAGLDSIARELPLLGTPLMPLADLLLQIHTTSKQPDGSPDASDVERDLARRLGVLQALTLGTGSSPPVEQTEAQAARNAGFGSLATNAAEESERLGELAGAEHENDTAKKQAEHAGELAAAAIAKLVAPVPGLGDGEVTGILKEYLSGLIEFSPLKDVFAAWAERLTSRTAPPAVADLVVPDPAKLKDAAAAQVNQEMAATPVTNPFAVQDLLGETGIAGAVGLVNQTRYLQENGTGPCDGCARPEPRNGNGAPGRGPEEPPVEPHIVP